MKKEMTFNKAFETLEKLVDEIEEDNIQIDKLASKVAEANQLIAFCETQLRTIIDEVDQANQKLEKKKGRPKKTP